MVKGLRRRPLTAETGVRFPYLLLEEIAETDKKVSAILVFRDMFCYNKTEYARMAGAEDGDNTGQDNFDRLLQRRTGSLRIEKQMGVFYE